MAESQLPKDWGEARDIILGNLPWILLLTGVELLFHEQWYSGIAALVGCLISLICAIYLGVFKNIGKDRDRRRRLFTWFLILAGTALLGWGIVRLGTQAGFRSSDSAELAEIKAELDDERGQRSALDRQLAATRHELQAAKTALDSLQERTRAAAPTPAQSSIAGKQFTAKTVRQLRALYEGRTALQADAFMADEKGKLIDVEGTVVMIHSGMAFLNTLENPNDSVECRFSNNWNPKLSTYRKGDTMKIRGTIAPTQNGAQIYLDDCEIRD